VKPMFTSSNRTRLPKESDTLLTEIMIIVIFTCSMCCKRRAKVQLYQGC
jgi:hypothetical protein